MGKKKTSFISIDKFLAQPKQTKITKFTNNIGDQSNSLLAMCLRFSFFRIELFPFLTLKCFKTLKMVCKEFNQILSSDVSLVQTNFHFKRFVKKNRFDLIELYFISTPIEKPLEIDFANTLDNFNFKTEFKYVTRVEKSRRIRNNNNDDINKLFVLPIDVCKMEDENGEHLNLSSTFLKAGEFGSVKTMKWLLEMNDKLKDRIITRHWISSEVLPFIFFKNQVKVVKYLLSLPGVHPYYIQIEAHDSGKFVRENWKMTEFICSQRFKFPNLDLNFIYRKNSFDRDPFMTDLIQSGDLETLVYLESLKPKMKGFELNNELMTYAGSCGHLEIMEWMVWVRPELRPLSFFTRGQNSFSCWRYSEVQIIAFLESIATEPLSFTPVRSIPSIPQSSVTEIRYGYSNKKKQNQDFQ